MSSRESMAMLEKRRIEAAILKHVYATPRASHGAAAVSRAGATPPRIELQRTQTVMQGASHCNFDYTFEE